MGVKSSSAASVTAEFLETEGNEVSTSFQRQDAARYLRVLLDETGADDKKLAEEVGMSKGQFSKVTSGQQGCLLDLVYRLPVSRANVRSQFLEYLAEREHLDPMTHAAEQAAIAAIRLICACRRGSARMAKADLPFVERRTGTR